jgi:hypothetical protein
MFIITVTNIMNPFKIDKSIFSFYSLAYNSFTPLESLEQNSNFIISTKAFPLNVNVGLPNNMPINTGPVQLYINTYQYVLIQVITNYQIPINYCLSINIPSSYIIQGSAYAVLSTVTNNFLIYNYTLNRNILILLFTLYYYHEFLYENNSLPLFDYKNFDF